jgi:hypothetical protein
MEGEMIIVRIAVIKDKYENDNLLFSSHVFPLLILSSSKQAILELALLFSTHTAETLVTLVEFFQ